MKSIINALRANDAEIVILPPAGTHVPSSFQYVTVDTGLYHDVLAATQRFRGGIYLSDGALLSDDLTKDGRHCVPIDQDSWHVVTMDKKGSVSACLRFLEERVTSAFDDLWFHHSSISRCPRWGQKVRRAVETEMISARKQRIRFGEVGGWAIAPDRRCTVEGLRTILATYGLLQVLGGCVGLATATVRHGSAPILRRIGLGPLEVDGQEVPPYYDPQYRCDMEVLRYDSRRPNSRFAPWVKELSGFLLGAPVICCSRNEPAQAVAAVDRQRVTAWVSPVPVPAAV